MSRTVLILFAALAGCASTSSMVHFAVRPAAAPAGSKGVGDSRATLVSDGQVVFAVAEPASTFAQSGEGTLGDRVFRLDEYGVLEGCRWVPRGRICQVVTLPDGSPLSGSLTWLVPPGARATPQAGGWLAASAFVPPGGAWQASFGSLFHCRFTDAGPRCLPATVEGSLSFTVLASLTLAGSGVDHDVLWIRPTQVFSAEAPAGQAEVFHRCEAAEDQDEVRCRPAKMR